jgi:hypothetical protein
MDEEEIAAIKAGYAAHAQRVNARLGYRYVAPAAPQPAVAQPAAPVQPVKPIATAPTKRDSQHGRMTAIAVGVVTWLSFAFFGGGLSCRDGWHSPSIGRQGACSHHGGVALPWGSPLLGIIAGFGVWFIIHHPGRKRETIVTSPRPVERPEGRGCHLTCACAAVASLAQIRRSVRRHPRALHGGRRAAAVGHAGGQSALLALLARCIYSPGMEGRNGGEEETLLTTTNTHIYI